MLTTFRILLRRLIGRSARSHATPMHAATEEAVVINEASHNKAHLVPYDENLLERARTQWQFGDWISLMSTSGSDPFIRSVIKTSCINMA